MSKFTTRKGLKVLGDANIHGDLGITGDVGVSGQFEINYPAGSPLFYALNVTGDSFFNGNVNIEGDVDVDGNLTYLGDLSINGGLNVVGVTGTIIVDDFYLEFSNTGLVKGPSGGPGLEYVEDYSDTFVDNSLVSKKFVEDGFVAINQQDGIIIVDDEVGDDITALPYRLDLPFKTIGAASLVAVSGDIIVVRPGTYPESGITLPAGVTVRGDGSWPNVFIGDLAATANIFEIGVNCTIRDVSLFMPSAGFAAVLYDTATVTTDRASLYSINFIGDESTGLGVGMYKTNNTGRLIGSDINCSTGGYSCIGKVEGGVMTLDNLRFATTLSGTIECLFEAEAQATTTPILQISGLNCGAPAISYVVKSTHAVDPVLNTTAPIIVMFNTNCVNAANFAKIDCSGTFLGLYGGKINTSATGFDVEVDPSVEAKNAANVDTTVQITAANQSKFSFPPAILGADLSLSYFSERTETLEGGIINIGADFVVGGPEIGANSYLGKGRPVIDGTFVFTTDATASPSSNGGNFVNETVPASTRLGSTFTFQGATAGNSILFTSARREEDLEYIRWYGLQISQTIAAVGGEFVFEIQTAANTWEPIRIQAVEKTLGYRYANFALRRANSRENIAFSTDATTTWPATTINGIPGRWARVRITSAPTTLPVFEQVRILNSHTFFSIDGYRNAYGLGKWQKSITVAGSVFSEDGSVGDTSITVGTGAVTWNQPLRDSQITSTALSLGSQIAIPGGICTAFPLFITLYYVPYRTTSGTSTVTAVMTGKMDAIPIEASGILVADPLGGITPVPRSVADTETLIGKSGTTFTKNLTEVGETITGTSGRDVRTVKYGPFFIDDYYEGDLLFFRFSINTFGTLSAGNAAFKMVGMDIEGVAFTDGRPQQ
jgi:hypothetical protein